MSTQQFEAEGRNETRVVRLRKHGRHLVLPVLVLVALAGFGGYFIGNLPEPWMNVAALVAAPVLGLLLGVLPILSWLSTRTTVTTRRLIIRRGFLVHHRSEIPLGRIREVRTRRGMVQRMFGCGDIELLVGVDHPVVVRDAVRPQLVVDALQELIQVEFASERGAWNGGVAAV